MSWLTKIALKKRRITFLIVALVTGASLWATITFKMELIPDIQFPVTSVVTVYPQAKPDEVLQQVTLPVEDVISGVTDLDHIISTSAEGSSFVFAVFDYGRDMDKVNEVISQQLNQLDVPAAVREVPAKMPQIKENPQLFAININMMPVVILSLSGDLPPDELQEMAVTKIMPRLEGIKGVYRVGIGGGEKEEVLVSLNPVKMNEYGIAMSRVAGILSAGEYNSLAQIEDTPMETNAVTLRDLARVDLGPPPGSAISRTNGDTSVSITVTKAAEANTVSVANAVVDEARKIKTTLGEGVMLTTVLDQSDYIEMSISNLTRNAVIGGALAIIVVFLFLMVFRASLVTAVSIPLSILLGFLAMRGMGITINILTLSAMAIVVGRVIDNSIVVLEVIYRRMQQGEDFRDAALGGVREVAAPITSATVATVIIFIPLTFVGGIVGELFVPFALTITFALVASLLVALMVVPPLSNFPVTRAGAEAGNTWYQSFYTRILKWSLAHRGLTLVIAAALFFGSFALIPVIGTAFMPEMSEKQLTVAVEMPAGTDLVTLEKAVMAVEKIIGENPKVRTYQTTAGNTASLMSGGAMMGQHSWSIGGINIASIMVILDRNADLEKETGSLRGALQGTIAGGNITVTSEQAAAAQMMGSGLDIAIRGENYADIARLNDELLRQLEGMAGISNLETDIAGVERKLNIEPDIGQLRASRLPAEQLPQEFSLLGTGRTVARANIDGRAYDVFLKGITQDLNNAEIARELRIGWPKSVALGDIATVELGEQPTSIQRIDRRLAVSITGSIDVADIGSVNRAIQKKIDALPAVAETEVKMGGTAELMGESFSGMFTAIIVAVALAYAVIVVTFRSFLNPLIIMVSLPLASVGALLGLLLAGRPIGVSAMMGVLLLVGIVLTNAIVLIALVEQLHRRGLSVYDALVEGGRTRLRPILMTALTTMMAMLPLALGLGEGTLMAAELAIVVIGGLFSSTVLTLLVIPVLYSLATGLRRQSVSQQA